MIFVLFLSLQGIIDDFPITMKCSQKVSSSLFKGIINQHFSTEDSRRIYRVDGTYVKLMFCKGLIDNTKFFVLTRHIQRDFNQQDKLFSPFALPESVHIMKNCSPLVIHPT